MYYAAQFPPVIEYLIKNNPYTHFRAGSEEFKDRFGMSVLECLAHEDIIEQYWDLIDPEFKGETTKMVYDIYMAIKSNDLDRFQKVTIKYKDAYEGTWSPSFLDYAPKVNSNNIIPALEALY
jgi:hypothetical protein